MKDQQDDYIGNIWGWKFSLIGLVVILIFVCIMIYGYQFKAKEIPPEDQPTEKTGQIQKDYPAYYTKKYEDRLS